jgi:hypothetical protein
VHASDSAGAREAYSLFPRRVKPRRYPRRGHAFAAFDKAGTGHRLRLQKIDISRIRVVWNILLILVLIPKVGKNSDGAFPDLLAIYRT